MTARVATILARAAALACVALLLAGLPALAQPQNLTERVTDDVGVLDGRAGQVEQVLDEVHEDAGVQLFVWYTDTTGGQPVEDFAEETAAASSLGGNDALLVVALTDRSYALWVADELTEVSDDDVARVSTDVVEPRLAAGDFVGAATAAAQALGEARTGGVAPGGQQPQQEADGEGPGLGTILVVGALLVLGAMALVDRIRARRGTKRTKEERDERLGALAREANTLLVAADEAIREAEVEVGYAEAAFREEDVEPIRRALDAAREELHGAFAVRQQLDDDVPDTAEEREAMLTEIVARAQRVDTLLTPEHKRLDALRDLERRAPEILGALPGRLVEAEARRSAAEPLLERVARAASESAEAVDGNLVEAAKAIDGVSQLTRVGTEAHARGDTRVAVDAVRDAEAALARVIGLIEAVEHVGHSLDEAERSLDADLRSAEAAVASARQAASTLGADAPARVAEAETYLEQARARRADDVVVAHGLVRKASAKVAAVLAEAEQAQERRAAEHTAATAALGVAETAYARAADFLAARRTGVGREARTRLQEAERHVRQARALLDHDALRATSEAETAERLADEAYRLAQRDFRDYDRHRGPFGRGPYGGGGRRRGGAGVIVIGGFPIPIGGSGRGGGGWGGSPWGSGGGGRSMGGGFGGGRSVGGGFGGGGGRVSGGRF